MTHYGINRKEKDGYNRTCKPCRLIIGKYRRTPDRVFIHELPIVYRNRAILKLLNTGKVHTLKTQDQDRTVEIDTTENAVKMTILKVDGSMETRVEMVDAHYEMCMNWILEYLNQNHIWLVWEYDG